MASRFRGRPLRWTVRGLVLVVAAATIGIAASPASAHTPEQYSYNWTCSGGDGPSQDEGDCGTMSSANRPAHHSYANARMFYDFWVGFYGYTDALNAGVAAWDRTDGHQFDFIVEGTDTTSNANVTVTGFIICGSSSAVGCTTTAVDSYRHIVEGTARIEFKTGISSGLIDDVAAHEFGHYAGLGHSASSAATMWGSVFSGQVSLHTWDKAGRCQIYGHAHGYWGGC